MIEALLQEKLERNRPRWLRMDELPFSKPTAYRLIDRGDIIAVMVHGRKDGKGIRLVDANSLDAYLERLAVEQKGSKWKPATRAKNGEKGNDQSSISPA